MTDSRNDRTQKKENAKEGSKPTADKEELENILDQISEGSGQQAALHPHEEAGDEIIKKPEGLENQPDDIEGMLEKISEKPARKAGFFQKLLNFFRVS